jgi:hypothetical protein
MASHTSSTMAIPASGNVHSALTAALLIVGVYLPTSFGGNSSKLLVGFGFLLSLVLIVRIIIKTKKLPSYLTSVALLFAVPMLLLFSVTSKLSTYTPGALAAYVVISCMFLVNVRQIEFPASVNKVFIGVNVVNILFCIAVLLESSRINDFLSAHYSMFYPELVPNMLRFKEPVLTFATHSLAGFFHYLFFYANFQTYKILGRKLFLAFALCYLVFMVSLISVTGLAFGLFAAFQVLYHACSRIRRWQAISLLGGAALLAVIMSFQFTDSLKEKGAGILQFGTAVATSPAGGFSGRFMVGGTLYGDIQYFERHPFSPVGITYRDDLMFADSGWLEYLLRGSFVLLLWAYGGLFFFLRRSLLSRADLYMLFGAIVAFEFGFTVLTYFRTAYLLLFFIIYLNHLRRAASATATRLRGPSAADHPAQTATAMGYQV